MTQPDFSAMTKTELRAYVIAHPNDKAAFQAFVDRYTAEAPSETFANPQTPDEVEEVEKLVQQRVDHLRITSEAG